MTECKCRVCVRWQRWWNVLKPNTPEELAVMEEIYEDLAGAETDAVFWRMKFQGTWARPICRATLPVSEIAMPNCPICYRFVCGCPRRTQADEKQPSSGGGETMKYEQGTSECLARDVDTLSQAKLIGDRHQAKRPL